MLERLMELFRGQRCWMLATLAAGLECSASTARRTLRQAGYCRSYTHNGMWYTLRGIPRFDRDGIWFWKDAGFSRHGNLVETIRYWIERSPAGLTAAQIEQRLNHPCQAVLSLLHKHGRIARTGSARKYIYIGAEAAAAQRQREALAAAQVLPVLVPEVAVWVLVEHIHDPALSFVRLAQRVTRAHGFRVDPRQIEAFFRTHALKKTAPPTATP
jgi:hypothetical protein